MTTLLHVSADADIVPQQVLDVLGRLGGPDRAQYEDLSAGPEVPPFLRVAAAAAGLAADLHLRRVTRQSVWTL